MISRRDLQRSLLRDESVLNRQGVTPGKMRPAPQLDIFTWKGRLFTGGGLKYVHQPDTQVPLQASRPPGHSAGQAPGSPRPPLACVTSLSPTPVRVCVGPCCGRCEEPERLSWSGGAEPQTWSAQWCPTAPNTREPGGWETGSLQGKGQGCVGSHLEKQDKQESE